MDNRFYVSLEAARLLKEKGYNEQCDYCFYYDDYHDKWDFDSPYNLFDDDPMYYNNETIDDEMYSMPTKTEVIDWLESKGIVVSVVYENLGIIGKKHYRSIINTLDKEGSESGSPIYLPSYDGDIRHYSTRLQAEEAAIIKACELL